MQHYTENYLSIYLQLPEGPKGERNLIYGLLSVLNVYIKICLHNQLVAIQNDRSFP